MVCLVVGEYSVYMRDRVGRGGFATIFRARHNDTGEIVAAKQLVSDLPEKHLEKELKAFWQLPRDHKNIIKLFNIRKDIDFYIFMELCKFGDLNNYDYDHPQKFDDLQGKLDIMLQFASGLEYLHENKVVHRDIKPGNILLQEDPDQVGHAIVRISDFGLSYYLDPTDSASSMSSNVGTQMFKAPEFWARRPDEPAHYKKSIDIFSTGLTFLAMIQNDSRKGENLMLTPQVEGAIVSGAELMNSIGLNMFNRYHHNQRQINIVIEIPYNDIILNMVRRIIRQCTFFNADERITAKGIHDELKRIAQGQPVTLPECTQHELQDSPRVPRHPVGSVGTTLDTTSGATGLAGTSSTGLSAEIRAMGIRPEFNPLVTQPQRGIIAQAMDMSSSSTGSGSSGATMQNTMEETLRTPLPTEAPPHHPFGTFQKAVADREILGMCDKVSPGTMKQVGILCLDISMEEIRTFEQSRREEVHLVGFDIINRWLERNPGADTRRKLHGLLQQATKQGLLPADVYDFLLK